jgi:hypothetical protein
MQLFTLALGVAVLCAVVALTAVQLRGRRFRWLLAGMDAVLYLGLAKAVSWLLVGTIYPSNPALSGVDPAALQLLFVVHSVVSMGTAAVTVVLANAGVRRVLPRTGSASG